MKNWSYPERLRELGLPTMIYRRRRDPERLRELGLPTMIYRRRRDPERLRELGLPTMIYRRRRDPERLRELGLPTMIYRRRRDPERLRELGLPTMIYRRRRDPERLRELGLPTMIYRCRRADVLQIFRIISGRDKVQSNKIFQLAGDTATRGHSLKIYKLRANSRVKANTLGVRVVNDWNALPESVVKSESINIFKSRLEDVWGDKVWRYDKENHY